MKDSPFHPVYWPSWLAIGLLKLWTAMPYGWMYHSGMGLGWLMDKTLKSRRHVVDVNMRLCYPNLSDGERNHLVTENMKSTGLGLLESAYSWWATDEEIIERSEVEGLEHIDKARKEGRGVLCLGAHYTTLDLSGRVYGARRPVDIIYRPQKNQAFNHVINSSRTRYLGELIDKRDMRKMVKRLKQGNTVWIASDQDMGPKGAVFAPFFGVSAATLTTIKQLIRLTGAKPLFYAHYRIDDGSNSQYLGRIIDAFDEKIGLDNLEDARQMNQAIEDSLLDYPEQYLWVHRRFKTRPNKHDPDLYRQF